MTFHYTQGKFGSCLRCGMTYENMVKRHRVWKCRGDNRDPKTGQPYPAGFRPKRVKDLTPESMFS